MVKEYLKEHKFSFEDLNVAEDAKARNEMIEKTQQMGVPVVEIGKKMIVGFDKEAIDAELKRAK